MKPTPLNIKKLISEAVLYFYQTRGWNTLINKKRILLAKFYISFTFSLLRFAFKRLKGAYIMAVPKRKTSKAKTRSRKSNWKLCLPGTTSCSNCSEVILSHRVCKHCGHYAGKTVITEEA